MRLVIRTCAPGNLTRRVSAPAPASSPPVYGKRREAGGASGSTCGDPILHVSGPRRVSWTGGIGFPRGRCSIAPPDGTTNSCASDSAVPGTASRPRQRRPLQLPDGSRDLPLQPIVLRQPQDGSHLAPDHEALEKRRGPRTWGRAPQRLSWARVRSRANRCSPGQQVVVIARLPWRIVLVHVRPLRFHKTGSACTRPPVPSNVGLLWFRGVCRFRVLLPASGLPRSGEGRSRHNSSGSS